MKLTLCFMTGRVDPRLHWMIESLMPQMRSDDEIELLVIDALGRSMPTLDPWFLSRPFRSFRARSPMPNIWQGKHRVTRSDFWATATARNTALVLCNTPYIAFVDDRCHLGPDWLSSVRRYEDVQDAVLVGSYDKYEDGNKTSEDHRRLLEPSGKRNCTPGWLYGCSFALPLAWCLEVNGFEEGTNGLTGEDYIFGLMLANADHALDFVPEMFVYQDRSQGNVTCKGIYTCMDKGVSPNDKSHAALDRFGTRTRTEFTPDLAKLRSERLRAEARGETWSFPIPDPNGVYLDWYDGQDIRTM